MGTGLGAGGGAQPATLPGIQAKVEGTEDSQPPLLHRTCYMVVLEMVRT